MGISLEESLQVVGVQRLEQIEYCLVQGQQQLVQVLIYLFLEVGLLVYLICVYNGKHQSRGATTSVS